MSIILAVIFLQPALAILSAVLGAIFPAPCAKPVPAPIARPRRYAGTKTYSIPTRGEV